MYVFKKIVGHIFLPVPLCVEILLLGLLLLWFTRRQRTGKVLVTLAAALLAGFGYYGVSSRILLPLERAYPPLADEAAAAALARGDGGSLRWIVVLGGGHRSDPAVPITSQLSDASLGRIVEAVRLYREFPGAKLVLSGGHYGDPVSDARAMARVAETLGVLPDRIVLEGWALDTKDQAREIKAIVGDDPFLLVTCASHMPRSMAILRGQGLRPVAAPAHYLARKRQGFHPGALFPDAEGLQAAERAVYEYLGLLWAELRGQT